MVTGFGRCGSSLVMQMLEAGGVPVTGEYPAFEDAAVPPHDPSWWRHYAGSAVKVLPHGLSLDSLPFRTPPFRIVLCTRDHREQAKSSVKFLSWIGLRAPRGYARSIRRSFDRDLPIMRRWLARMGSVVEVSFERAITDPAATARQLRDHVATEHFDVGAAARCVIDRQAKCLDRMLEEQLDAVRAAGVSP